MSSVTPMRGKFDGYWNLGRIQRTSHSTHLLIRTVENGFHDPRGSQTETGSSKYSETHTFDVYDIMRQLNDSRFRGRHGIGHSRVINTEATIRGDLFAHSRLCPELSPKPFRQWRRWRPDTSNIHHAMTAGHEEQKFVFSANPKFDQLRIDTANNDKPVEVKGYNHRI